MLNLLSFIQTAANEGLTTGGWIFLTISWVFVIGFTIYCFYRVLTTPESKD